MTNLLVLAIISINRAVKQMQPHVLVPVNKIVKQTLQILLNLGYLQLFQLVYKGKNKSRPLYQVVLKYTIDNKPVLRCIETLSTKGNLNFIKYKHLNRMVKQINGLDPYKILLMSTPKNAICTSQQALLSHTGGKLLAIIY